MSTTFLLEITIEASDDGLHMFDLIVAAIEAGLKQVNHTYLQLFQVSGEDKILVVLDQGLQNVKQEVRRAAGRFVRFTCTPLRTYENFSRMLGVTDGQLLVPQRDLDGPGQLFWINAKVGYHGLGSRDELFRRWKFESEAALGARASGHIKMDVYKVVSQTEVHAFIKIAGSDEMDELLNTFPMVRDMGDQMIIVCKGLYPINTQIMQKES